MKKSLQERLSGTEQVLSSGLMTEEQVARELVNIIYEYYQENLLTLILQIQQMDIDRIKREKMILYRGLEDGMHGMSILSEYLLEENTSRQAKDSAKFYFEPDDGNIAMLINIAKAYFPNGTSEGASKSGKWFFDKFVSLLKNNKEKYLEGGDSYDWAKSLNHCDYIDLVLKKNL